MDFATVEREQLATAIVEVTQAIPHPRPPW